MKSKAAIITEINKPLTVDTVSIELPLEYGQVIVKVLVSGLCGAQLQEIAGLKNNAKFMPHLTGHEGCGEVVDIGPGVKNVKVGQKVVMHWRKGNGIDANFPKYYWNNKYIGGGAVNTLCEYAVVSENRLTAINNNVPNDICALLGCGMSTAFGVINNDAKVKFGEKVLIIGCGGVGLNLIVGAKLASAGSIIGVDKGMQKQSLVESLGAQYMPSYVFDLLTADINCIIDTTGSLELVSQYIPFLAGDGRVIIVSQPKINSSLIITNPSNFFAGEGQQIITTQGGKIKPSTDIIKYANLHKSYNLHTNIVVTHRFMLDQINDAIDIMKCGQSGRIMIDINQKLNNI